MNLDRFPPAPLPKEGGDKGSPLRGSGSMTGPALGRPGGRAWLILLRPGDWLVMLAGLAAVVATVPLLWRGGTADLALVKRDGRVVAELPLTQARKLDVVGPLGTTVIEVQPGRARVASDPGPRQYCVLQGWLTRPNSIAICAPNHVSLQLGGREGGYDSLNY